MTIQQLQKLNITDDDVAKLIFWRAEKNEQTIAQYLQSIIKKVGKQKWGPLPPEVDARLNREIQAFLEEEKQGSTRPGVVGFTNVDDMMKGLEQEMAAHEED